MGVRGLDCISHADRANTKGGGGGSDRGQLCAWVADQPNVFQQNPNFFLSF